MSPLITGLRAEASGQSHSMIRSKNERTLRAAADAPRARLSRRAGAVVASHTLMETLSLSSTWLVCVGALESDPVLRWFQLMLTSAGRHRPAEQLAALHRLRTNARGAASTPHHACATDLRLDERA
jgi:hypothetical protein